ncbi:MAG: glycoside hydrolase family 27 protein [Acidobacteriota bacterium]
MTLRRHAAVLTLLVLTTGTLFAQKYEGLALTPPMGWNSWNKFGCNVDEAMIRAIADAMVSSGMKDAGYRYVVIDDCWHGGRDSAGFIRANPERFPSGMKALAEYVHAKGLKFGIYSCAGAKTCAGHPGSRGHEYQDALTYASWGVDYLKYDWCSTAGLNSVGAYMTMRDALFAAGRPVVFSICEWGDTKPWEWADTVGHLWRTTGDISPVFDGTINHGTWSSNGIMTIVEMRKDIRRHAGPGHWNDPDMLEVGNGMSESEDRAHFSLWCMMAAPLMAGNDVRSMSGRVREILTDPEAIAIDQDSLGIQGYRLESADSIEVWVKPLGSEDWAVCFLNRSSMPKRISHAWAKHPVLDTLSGRRLDASHSVYHVRDIWKKKDLGSTDQPIAVTLPSHDVLLVRLTQTSSHTR